MVCFIFSLHYLFCYTIKQLTLKSQMSKNRNIKMLKYIYKHIDSHIFINFFLYFIGMLLMRTSKRSTLQSKVIYHGILYRILTQDFTTITFQLLLVMSAQKWVEGILEMRRNHMLLQTFIILEGNHLLFNFTQIHSKLVNCYSCSSGLTVRELVVHVTNPTFCANQIWRLY